MVLIVKALVYTQPHRVELQELPDPSIKPEEVLIRVRAVGICGSDLDGFLGKSKKRIPPLVLGHEFSGEIVEIGRGVSAFRAGEAVAVYPLVSCGECDYCRTHRYHICPRRKVFGLDFHGGLSEYVSVPQQCLFRIPSGLSFLEGTLIEPLANAVHVLAKCPSVPGQTGLVYGVGHIGVLVYLAARHSGARLVAVVDRNPRRLAILKSLGANLVVDSSEQNPVEAILAWTEGRGVDFSVDAVGHSMCRQNAIACTAAGGTVIWIGLAGDVCEIDGRAVVTREVEIKGSYAYGRKDFARAISLLEQGLLPLKPLVTEAKMEQGQQVFEDLVSANTSLMKVIFVI
ncbi:MAG: hypothetical protein DMG06_03100 [Acidobacteria bacterium]|nr:MAG: hypothetical protein DMG06_03100 [Acidobacteriota bacterium]